MKAWYGTREASKCWCNEVTDTLIREEESHGYVTACHGDDFVSSGSASALDEFDRVLTTHFDTKILPRTGPTAYEVSEGKYLDRTSGWSPRGLE